MLNKGIINKSTVIFVLIMFSALAWASDQKKTTAPPPKSAPQVKTAPAAKTVPAPSRPAAQQPATAAGSGQTFGWPGGTGGRYVENNP